MRAVLAEQLDGIDGIRVSECPAPMPARGQVLVRVHGAGVGPWDVGFLGGGFPGVSLPFIPGQEIAGVVEASGEEAGFRPGERVYGTLFPAGGGFAELAVMEADRMAPMPDGLDFPAAAGLVIAAGTAHEGLTDRGHLHAGETVLVTAAAGGVGSAAVQIAAALGARVVAVASARNHDYLRDLGASEVYDYHDDDWPRQVGAAIRGGVDLVLDGAGGRTRDQAMETLRDGGRMISIMVQEPLGELGRGITGETFAAHGSRARLETVSRLVDDGSLRPQVEIEFPLDQARAALARVAGRHTRGKIVLRIR